MDWSNIGTGVQEEKQQREQLENQIADEGKKPLSQIRFKTTVRQGPRAFLANPWVEFLKSVSSRTIRRQCAGIMGTVVLSLSLWG